MTAHLDQGGTAAFLTLTLSHTADDALSTSLDAVREGWDAVRQSRRFRRLRARFGIDFTRALEVTWGKRNGWHPHLHVLLYFAGRLTPDEMEDLAAAVDAAWRAAAEARGRKVSTAYGTRLQPVDFEGGADALALYLTKVQDRYGDSRDIGREMTRGDLKKTKAGGGMSPFDLAEAGAAGDRRSLRLWLEYVEAIAGAKCLNWSVGLRQRLALGIEVEDEDLAEEEPPAETQLVARIGDEDWRRVCHYRAAARLLTLAEHRQADGVAFLLSVLRRREQWERSRQ